MDPFSNARSQRRDDVANRFSHLFNWPQAYTQVGLSMNPRFILRGFINEPRLILRWVCQCAQAYTQVGLSMSPGLYSGGFVNVPQVYTQVGLSMSPGLYSGGFVNVPQSYK